MESPTVAIYPSAGGQHGAHRCIFHGRKMHGVATNVYSRKTSEKSERWGLRTLIVKGSEVVFTHGEGISTPRVRHKGQQPLIKCAKHDFQIMYFSFFIFYIFWGRQGDYPCFYVSLCLRECVCVCVRVTLCLAML